MDNNTNSDVGLTIADLSSLKNIIDVASRRGAFHANELKEVGTVYERLSVFLEAIRSQFEQNPQEPTDEEQPQGETNA